MEQESSQKARPKTNRCWEKKKKKTETKEQTKQNKTFPWKPKEPEIVALQFCRSLQVIAPSIFTFKPWNLRFWQNPPPRFLQKQTNHNINYERVSENSEEASFIFTPRLCISNFLCFLLSSFSQNWENKRNWYGFEV